MAVGPGVGVAAAIVGVGVDVGLGVGVGVALAHDTSATIAARQIRTPMVLSFIPASL